MPEENFFYYYYFFIFFLFFYRFLPFFQNYSMRLVPHLVVRVGLRLLSSIVFQMIFESKEIQRYLRVHTFVIEKYNSECSHFCGYVHVLRFC